MILQNWTTQRAQCDFARMFCEYCHISLYIYIYIIIYSYIHIMHSAQKNSKDMGLILLSIGSGSGVRHRMRHLLSCSGWHRAGLARHRGRGVGPLLHVAGLGRRLASPVEACRRSLGDQLHATEDHPNRAHDPGLSMFRPPGKNDTGNPT